MSLVVSVIGVQEKHLAHWTETTHLAVLDVSALTEPVAVDRHHTSGQR